MSHKSVRNLIRDATKSLADNIQFGYGRRSDFNLVENKAYPFVWLLPLTATTTYNAQTRTKNWSCILVIISADTTDSTQKQYDDILDDMDNLGDQIIQRIQDWYLSEQDIVGELTLANINQTTIIKGDADIHTGWLFTFQMQVSDSFDYCENEITDLRAEENGRH